MLNIKEIKFFEMELEKRKIKIERNLSAIASEMKSMQNNDLKDEADHALMSLESSVENAILGQQSQELAEIELALDRIKNETYGICDMCTSEINIERLKVKNFACYCITCREVVEKE